MKITASQQDAIHSKKYQPHSSRTRHCVTGTWHCVTGQLQLQGDALPHPRMQTQTALLQRPKNSHRKSNPCWSFSIFSDNIYNNKILMQ